jgi:hypothetical protein
MTPTVLTSLRAQKYRVARRWTRVSSQDSLEPRQKVHPSLVRSHIQKLEYGDFRTYQDPNIHQAGTGLANFHRRSYPKRHGEYV